MPNVNVVFVEPSFPPTQRNFVRALAEVGATVIGIGESHGDGLDEQVKSWMSHYHHVPSVVDVGVMTDAVRWIQGQVWVDRVDVLRQRADDDYPRNLGTDGMVMPG